MIQRHLSLGRDRALKLGELAERLNLPRRAIEQAIQEARLAGVPIVTDSRGAYLASTSQEARYASERLRSRAIHQLETAKALERAADAMDVEPLTLPWDVAA